MKNKWQEKCKTNDTKKTILVDVGEDRQKDQHGVNKRLPLSLFPSLSHPEHEKINQTSIFSRSPRNDFHVNVRKSSRYEKEFNTIEMDQTKLEHGVPKR